MKKITLTLLALVTMLCFAFGFAACGGNEDKGVSLFGKTYVFSDVATYSMTDMQENTISDWKQWIKDNFEKDGDFQFGFDTTAQSKETAEDLIAYLESGDFINNLSTRTSPIVLLKGATVTIEEGRSTGNGKEKSANFHLSFGGDKSLDATITSNDYSAYKYDVYDRGKVGEYQANPPLATDTFKLTDCSRKDGSIKDAVVYLSKDNEVFATSYGYGLVGKNNTFVSLVITYHLQSVN